MNLNKTRLFSSCCERTARLFAGAALLATPLGAGAAWGPPEVALEGGFSFVSEYIDSGAKAAGASFQPSLFASTALGEGSLALGTWSNLPVDGPEGNELQFIVEGEYPVLEAVSVGAGFTYFMFPEDSVNTQVDRSREVFVALLGNVRAVEWSAAAMYDFDLDQVEVEGVVGYLVDLERFLPGTALVLEAYAGYVKAEDLNGGQGPDGGTDAYAYVGGEAGLEYVLSENVVLSLGSGLAHNNDGQGGNSVNPDATDTFFYWSAGVTFLH
jgi:hypothetical protein